MPADLRLLDEPLEAGQQGTGKKGREEGGRRRGRRGTGSKKKGDGFKYPALAAVGEGF